MRQRVLGVAVAILVCVAVASASGAATTKAQQHARVDVSTRASVIHYLRSLRVDPKGVVIQRSLRNYAGAHCPGKGWSCTSTSHPVVQVAKVGGKNTFRCATASCAVVQVAATASAEKNAPTGNTATCVKTSGLSQSCTISQSSSTASNTAIVYENAATSSGLTQTATATASITQKATNSGSNTACVYQNIALDNSTVAKNGTPVTVTSEAHQTLTIHQDSASGGNTAAASATSGGACTGGSLVQTQKLTSVANGAGSITQNEDAAANGPNVFLDIEQNQSNGFKGLATGTNSATFNQTSNLSAIANTSKGPVSQTQSSPDINPPYSGLVAAFNQDSKGISNASATQTETQCEDAANTAKTPALTQCDQNDPDAPTGYSLTQKQFGPEGIFTAPNHRSGRRRVPFVHKTPGDASQTGNLGDDFTVNQSSTQNNDTQSGQSNTVSGGVNTSGTGNVTQNTLIQGNGKEDVQAGTNANVAGTINCPAGSTSCTKTLSAPTITTPPNPGAYGAPFTFSNPDPTVGFVCILDTNPVPCTTFSSSNHTGAQGTYTGAPSGLHTFVVETIDPGNPASGFAATAPYTWVVTPPDPSITVKPSNPDAYGDSGSFKFTDNDSTATFKCSLDGATPYTTCTSGGAGASYSGLASGSHTFSVKAYDTTGTYPSVNAATYTWVVTPPDPTITPSSEPTNPDFAGNNYAFAFTDWDSTVHYQCQIDSQSVTSCNSGSASYSALDPGSHTFSVTAYDQTDAYASNDPATYTWTILPLEVSAFGGDGSSAGWACQPGGPIGLTLGTDTSNTFAEIDLTDAGGTALDGLPEPTFTTDNYAAGSPRYYITLDNGHSLWGYPPNSGLNDTDFAWAIDNSGTYESWADVQSAESGATVTGVSVIADGDQDAGVTDKIGDLTFNGTDFNSGSCPAPPSL